MLQMIIKTCSVSRVALRNVIALIPMTLFALCVGNAGKKLVGTTQSKPLTMKLGWMRKVEILSGCIID
jgi:hypothetical protein